VARQEPLPRWAWPVMGVALVALALFAWSLRLQQGRSLEIRDPDGLIGPAEVVEMGQLGMSRSVGDGPFVHEGRLGLVVLANECPRVTLDARRVDGGVTLLRVGPEGGSSATGGADCSSVAMPWAVLMTPDDPSLLERPIEIVPLDGSQPPSIADAPYGTWSPPYPGSTGAS
jgi:hypothetical protein